MQEDTDKSFIKKHQAVVKQQTSNWASSEGPIKGALIDKNPYFPEAYGSEPTQTPEEKKKPSAKSGKQGSGSSASHLSKSPSGKSQGSKAGAGSEAGDASGVDNGDASGLGTMSAETRMALPGALKEIFARHHVCRYNDLNMLQSFCSLHRLNLNLCHKNENCWYILNCSWCLIPDNCTHILHFLSSLPNKLEIGFLVLRMIFIRTVTGVVIFLPLFHRKLQTPPRLLMRNDHPRFLM